MRISLTFAGCGYLGVYHIGAMSCLQEYAPALLRSVANFGGCSAGALAAAALATDVPLTECANRVFSSAKYARNCMPFKLGQFLAPLHPYFDIVEMTRRGLEELLPHDAHVRCTGRLHISLSRVTLSRFENDIVCQYDTREDLIEALLCTSFVPFYSGIVPPKFKGVAYVDGGFTDNLPQHFSGTTITVSPFSGESDICPDDSNETQTHFDWRNTSVKFTSQNLYRMSRAFFPPSADVLSDMCRQGFKDALKYLHIHYPEMLNIGIARVHIPECCMDSESDEDTASACSCTTVRTCLTDVESTIAERNTILDTVVPHKLNEILHGTREFIVEGCDVMSWYMVRVFLRIVKWLARPCVYTIHHLGSFAHEMVLWLIPKIKEISSQNYYTSMLVNMALEVFYSYTDKHQCERHPSLNDRDFTYMARATEKIRAAQRCMRAVPLDKIEDKSAMKVTPCARKKVKPPNMEYLGLSPRKSSTTSVDECLPKEDTLHSVLKRQLSDEDDWAVKSFSCQDFLYIESDQTSSYSQERRDSFDDFVYSFVDSDDDGIFSDSSVANCMANTPAKKTKETAMK